MKTLLIDLVLRFGLLTMSKSSMWAQGPPFQTDDPVSVDFHHYEMYVFGSADESNTEMDSAGPAVEFNWGAVPRAHLHAILPLGVAAPFSNPTDSVLEAKPTRFGVTDAEIGAVIAYLRETKYLPQVSTYTMVELPTGAASSGLGVGKAWYKLPIWTQKNFGHWLLDGGVGETIVPQTGYHNFPYGGFW